MPYLFIYTFLRLAYNYTGVAKTTISGNKPQPATLKMIKIHSKILISKRIGRKKITIVEHSKPRGTELQLRRKGLGKLRGKGRKILFKIKE